MKITIPFDNLNIEDRKLLYMDNVRPLLRVEALFHDATEFFRSPSQPLANSTVRLRFRTARYNADAVYVVSNGEEISMVKTRSDKTFDYYETTLSLMEEPVFYYFKIRSGKITCYYNQLGPLKDPNIYYDFQIMPGFVTPKWARGAVMYQIYVDRFFNGNPDNDVQNAEYSYYSGHVIKKNWDENPSLEESIREFYGGDLDGVLQKMDYLSDLGVEVIYFNPLFVSPSNHKYDIQDYSNIDPHFGRIVDDSGEVLEESDQDNTHASRYINRVTNPKNLQASNELFAQVVQEAHKRGMRVIIDGVFNHCGSFNRWMDREHIYMASEHGYDAGAFIAKESPYHNYFSFSADEWPDNGSYEGWWGYNTLPKLNYEGSKELEDYILDIGRKWVSAPYNADGWRLDVAADLGHSPEYNHSFWKKFRKAVKSANPEAIILAENYGDSYNWLQGDEWDTVMNYDAFMEPVTWFLTGMQKHSDEYREDLLGNADSFFDAMRYNSARLGGQAVMIAMNELSNHDHSRFLTRTNRTVGRLNSRGSEAASEHVNKAVMMEAVTIQMTWPGAPTIYYGDEVGLCGWTDPDNRRPFPWGREDKLLLDFHREIIKIHKQYPVFREGSVKKLKSEYNLIVYGRFTEDEQMIIAVNNNPDEKTVKIPVWQIGFVDGDDCEQVIATYENGYSTEPLGYSVNKGMLTLGLRKTSAVVLKKKVW